jgi:heme/copper-type cytochrome/quinol oxidase subunit 1
MPRLSMWMVRLSLVALLAGAVVGAFLLSGLPGAARCLIQLRGLHLDLMLFGWLIQFVLGVAYWILPRYAARPERGPEAVAWTAFGIFQTGMALAAAGASTPSLQAVAPAGRLLLTAATLLFTILLFPRIKPFGAP